MKIVITGGNGYVGGHLTAQLRAAGHDVTVFTRQSPATDLHDFDALIHAAWDFANPESNVAGSFRLLEAAKAASISRIVFISSLSAFDGCRSQYGTTKLVVEKRVSELGGCVVRLGFVCDDSGRGLSGSLRKLAAFPLIPLPGGGVQNLYTIWARDLGPAFLRILEDCGPENLRDRSEPINLAHPEPVSLANMMKAFARQQGKRAVFISIPYFVLYGPLRIAEAAGLRLKFRSDSLVSLMNQNPHPSFRKLRDLCIELHPFLNKG
jgi:nucleoside-diphosphate-sugar epimerase